MMKYNPCRLADRDFFINFVFMNNKSNDNMLADSHPLIAIVGPTASGKTNFAAHLAARLDAEIISADSRQVYRDMTIGTGKDLDDYIVDGQKIPYHLIDICNAGTKYNLFRYQEDFLDEARQTSNPLWWNRTLC